MSPISSQQNSNNTLDARKQSTQNAFEIRGALLYTVHALPQQSTWRTCAVCGDGEEGSTGADGTERMR